METNIIIAGFGGQGVMVIGQLLAYTASEQTEKHVTYFPSYGAEQRGGTANCYVVISDDEIGAAKVAKADVLVILNEPSMDRFKNSVAPGGAVIVNSTIVKNVPEYGDDITVINVDAGNIAQEIGNPRVMNLVMAGAIIGYNEILPPDAVLQTAFEKLGKKRPEFNPLNEKAFNRGLEIGRAARK